VLISAPFPVIPRPPERPEHCPEDGFACGRGVQCESGVMASDRFGFPVCELSLVLLKKTWSGDGVGFYLEGGDSIDSSPKHSKELNHGWMDGWQGG